MAVGNLIAMKPSSPLSGLLGLTAASGTTTDAYLKVDTTTAAGAGIVADTIQYHGDADRYALTAGAGTQSVATIYSSASAATTFPAVTLRTVGTRAGRRPRSRTTCRGRWSRPAKAIPPGRARSVTARTRSAPTTCSSAAARPTG